MARTDYLTLGLLAGGTAALAAWWASRTSFTASNGGGIFTYHMAAGAFDEAAGIPNVAVVIPPAFNPSGPLQIAVYFHGFTNCPENVVADRDGRCIGGNATHHSSHLAAQFVASGINGILVVPGLRREQATGDAGRFNRAGAFEAFLTELLGTHLAPHIGTKSLADIGRVSLMSHSGGYTAVAAVLRGASPALAPKIAEVALLDSLYGDAATFNRWVGDSPAALRPQANRRFLCVYTSGGGTATNATALSAQLRSRLGGSPSVCLDDSATEPTPVALNSCGAIVQRSGLSHTDVSRHWPLLAWSSSPLKA